MNTDKPTTYPDGNTSAFIPHAPLQTATLPAKLITKLQRRSTLALSTASVLGLLLLWYAITALHIVPCFCPLRKPCGRNLSKSANKVL